MGQTPLVALVVLAVGALGAHLITLVARLPPPGRVMRVVTEKTGHLLGFVAAAVALVQREVLGLLGLPVLLEERVVPTQLLGLLGYLQTLPVAAGVAMVVMEEPLRAARAVGVRARYLLVLPLRFLLQVKPILVAAEAVVVLAQA